MQTSQKKSPLKPEDAQDCELRSANAISRVLLKLDRNTQYVFCWVVSELLSVFGQLFYSILQHCSMMQYVRLKLRVRMAGPFKRVNSATGTYRQYRRDIIKALNI